MRVAVIGAGPAGLTAAYALTKVISTVDVYEASDAVGGLARSIRLWGQTVDIGSHRFFSSDKRVNELWLEVVGRDYAMVDRLSRILYQGRLLIFRKPQRRIYQSGVQVAFLGLIAPHELSESDSKIRLLRVRWRED